MKKYEFKGRYKQVELRWGEEAKLDKRDLKILDILSRNARTPISKIAKEVELGRDAVKYRMNKMEQEDVIQGYEVVVNPPKIGFPIFSYIALSMWNLTPEREAEFKRYVQQTPYFIWASKTMGNWDAFLFTVSKNPNHLNEIIQKIREKFGDIIKDIEITSVIHEYKFTQFPREA